MPAYGTLLMEGLSVLGTRDKHVNARGVQHLMGYLKNERSGEDKQEVLGLIEEYRQGMQFWLGGDSLPTRRRSEIDVRALTSLAGGF